MQAKNWGQSLSIMRSCITLFPGSTTGGRWCWISSNPTPSSVCMYPPPPPPLPPLSVFVWSRTAYSESPADSIKRRTDETAASLWEQTHTMSHKKSSLIPGDVENLRRRSAADSSGETTPPPWPPRTPQLCLFRRLTWLHFVCLYFFFLFCIFSWLVVHLTSCQTRPSKSPARPNFPPITAWVWKWVPVWLSGSTEGLFFVFFCSKNNCLKVKHHFMLLNGSLVASLIGHELALIVPPSPKVSLNAPLNLLLNIF